MANLNIGLNRRYFSPFWWREALSSRVRAAASKWNFKAGVVEKVIEGEKCRFYVADPTGRAWYGRELNHQNLEMRFIRDHLMRPGMTVLEVGGHHGHDTIPLSRWVGAGKVVTIEPVPFNAEIIRKNMMINDITNVEVIEAALGAETAAGMIDLKSNGSISTSRRGGTIKVFTLDDICRSTGIRPDLIKLDVEGYEVDVLMGAREILACRPILQIEIHPHALPKYGRSLDDFWSLVILDDYDYWLQTDDLEPPHSASVPMKVSNRCHLFAAPKARTASV